MYVSIPYMDALQRSMIGCSTIHHRVTASKFYFFVQHLALENIRALAKDRILLGYRGSSISLICLRQYDGFILHSHGTQTCDLRVLLQCFPTQIEHTQ